MAVCFGAVLAAVEGRADPSAGSWGVTCGPHSIKGFTVSYILCFLGSSRSQGSELDSSPLKSFDLTRDTAPVEIMELMQKLLGEVFWTELYQMTRLDDGKCPLGS